MHYEELDLHAHTLKRPDTYVGSVHPQTGVEYVLENGAIAAREMEHVPAVVRIFVEALSNAVDNVERSREFEVPCRAIKVEVDAETGRTSVWNDGLSIPVRKNESGIYIPEMLFGRLLTSSNYNDAEQRFTSGRNGLGITLANIFSARFEINIVDPGTRHAYRQIWSRNMRECGTPRITTSKVARGSTHVEWVPDFAYFGMQGYSSDTVALMARYVADAAMLSGVATSFNGERLPVRRPRDYARLLSTAENPDKELTQIALENSECVIMPSSSGFEHLSFVNGVYTQEGGAHVDAWAESLFRPLAAKLTAKLKSVKLSARDIKQYFRLVVTARLPNPEFATQTKSRLTALRPAVKVDDKVIALLARWSFADAIRDSVAAKELQSLKKTERKRGATRIEGLDPALKAGGKESRQCTLVLCEGLSAKTYAVMGIKQGIDFGEGVRRGREYFGVLPLRGKVINVRNATSAAIGGNKELSAIVQELGLQHGMDYSTDRALATLRYGRVMILADEDCDGLHIQGLLLNAFDVLWPSLVARGDFIARMATPLVSLSARGETLRFYDAETARQHLDAHPKRRYEVKYFKGLGTSSDRDVAETFGRRVIVYDRDDRARESLATTFAKERADDRKKWMAAYRDRRPHMEEVASGKGTRFRMEISEFIDAEMIRFSIEDCRRSLPHLVDGLKESQRKILHACFLRNLAPEGKSMKVAQLAGYVAEKTNYHHGEMCLFDTIVKMAQDFVGSNNIALLAKDGQFGSRLSNGRDAANARYIFTKLRPETRRVFPAADDGILRYIDDAGDRIEPEFFLPALPLILVNGVNGGIGTGWSSFVPSYDPQVLGSWIRRWLNGSRSPPLAPLVPWYRDFKGEIAMLTEGKFRVEGVMRSDGKRVVVEELPVGMCVDKYKEILEDLVDARVIKSFKNYSQPDAVRFEIVPAQERLNIDKLKLASTLSTSNMVMFDEHGTIRRYGSPEAVLESYCRVRLDGYRRRKAALETQFARDLDTARAKHAFLTAVLDGNLVLATARDDAALAVDLAAMGLPEREDGYGYLLSMPIRSFTASKLAALEKHTHALEKQLAELERQSPADMWRVDLDALGV